MTDENSNIKEATSESTKATPGQQLRQGREAMGLSQQQVADRLHLRLNNIQDIESDTHKPGVSITFTKGYVRIYAKLLGMPAEPLLEAFDVIHQGEKQPAKLQSFSQRVAKQANDDRWMMVTYLIVFLVLASLVIWWFQQAESDDSSLLDRFNWFTSAENEQATEEGELVSVLGDDDIDLPNANLPDELAVPESVVTEQENGLTNQDIPSEENLRTAESQATPRQEATPGQETPAQEIIRDVQELAEETVQPVVESASESANDLIGEIEDAEQSINTPSDLNTSSTIKRATFNDSEDYRMNDDGTVDVVFTFSEDCWLQVTDANDDVKAVGVKVQGRVMPIQGVPPISVNMCPPEYVEINFAGRSVDLSSYTRGVPVKFELSVQGE